MKQAVKQGIDNLKTEDIKEELERTGTVVRRKAEKVGAAIADAAANAKITAAIKTKLAVDSQLSSLKISVDTTDGLVTLSGSVGAYDEIGKAIRIALETDGVRQVVSTLQVKPSTKPN
jgi:hyperosmotically inducible protein